MIPKIVHQYWHDGFLPAEESINRSRFVSINPGFTFILWTREDVIEDLADEWTIEHSTRAGEANMVRLYALLRHGGIWLDTDFVPVKPLDSLLDHKAFVAKQPDGVFCNAAMGAEPNHPWVNAMIKAYGDQRTKDAAHGCHIIAPTLTPDVAILPTDTFYPYAHGEPPKPPTDATIAIHQWKGSWIKLT